ncbi:MAG: HDOD domain-containing protein [Epsilonproteobacteria bacterium]|nr:hypothetical protein [Campylobacterota bacterium]NPA56628.1 HDOD domain-containing protein [Campylobacterota bacterium]
MGLFGFGKKKEHTPTAAKEEELSFKALTKRAYPRYLVENLSASLGKVIDISKNSVLFAASGLKEGDYLDVEIDGKSYEGSVARTYGNKVVLRFDQEFPKELIESHMKKVTHEPLKPQRTLDTASISNESDVQSDKAIINLMLEIEDPNTNIAKFRENIEALPELKEKILSMANSIEIGGRGRISDVGSAVTRLGFEAIKRIVYQYVMYEASLSHNDLKYFENFELYNIFLGATFKKISPLFSFKDTKNEGQSLLTMSSVGALVISRECPEIAPLYRGVEELYSYPMRMVERWKCGYDFLEIDGHYFTKDLQVFKYLYDGFVLANYMLYPHYSPQNLKVSLSQRKLRFAYVSYLTLLAQKFVFAKDKNSGFILLQRMQRLGFTLQEAKQWLDFIIENTNKKVARIGLEKKIPKPDMPNQMISLESYLGSGGYAAYFLEKIDDLSREAQRLAIRYEDEAYSHYVLDIVLNHERFTFLTMPFAIIPCDVLEDDELPLAMLEGFDLLIFKNIDRLDRRLFKEFEKIWKDFEGKIIVTFSTYSMIEYDQPHLYEVVREQIVDFPSYYQSTLLHMKMVNTACSQLNRLFGEKICDIEDFKGEMIDMETLYKRVLEKISPTHT